MAQRCKPYRYLKMHPKVTSKQENMPGPDIQLSHIVTEGRLRLDTWTLLQKKQMTIVSWFCEQHFETTLKVLPEGAVLAKPTHLISRLTIANQ